MNEEDMPTLSEAQPLSTVIELNHKLSRDSNGGNSVFTTVLTEGRTIMPGGTLSAKLTTINSKKNNSSDIIVPDKPIYFTFSYVDMDYDATNKKQLTSGNDWGEPTLTYYASYLATEVLQLDFVRVYYNGGPPGLGYVAQATFSYIDANGVARNNLNSPYRAPIIGNQLDLGAELNIQFRTGSLKLILLNGVDALDPTQTIPPSEFSYDPKAQPPEATQVIQDLGTQLYTRVFTIPPTALPPGAYDPGELANRLTQAIADSGGTDPGLNLWVPRNELLVRMDNQYQNDPFIWRRCRDPNGTPIVFNDATCYTYNEDYPIQKGAQLASIEYGKVGNVFQLSALHSPLYNAASPGTKNVGYRSATIDGVTGFYEVPVDSKIAIHDFHPPELLEALGLQGMITPLITDPTTGIQEYSLTSMLNHTTAENTPVGGFCPFYNPVVEDPAPGVFKYINTTDLNTRAIIGTPADPDPNPLYLMRITCGLGNISDYSATNGVLNDVAAIISKEYTSNSITTGYGGDSAVFYTHTGEPKTLQSFTVSIIDINTKQPVTDLDPNTIIHLEIDNPRPQAPDPITEVLAQLQMVLEKLSKRLG